VTRDPLILQRGDIPSVAWPPVHSHKTASLAALIHQLEATQWLSSDKVAAGQRAQLAVIAAHFAAQSDWFRARLAAAGLSPSDLGAPGGLQRLPLLTRREAQAEFAAEPALTLPEGHGPTGKISTSGSTGEPVVVWKTALSKLDWLAVTMRYYRWGNPDFSGRLAAIRALMARDGLYDDWGAPMAQFNRTGPMIAIEIATDVDRQIDMLAEFAPDCLIVYPSNLEALTTALEARNKHLPGIRSIWTLGETLYDTTRERARDYWGVDLFDAYSSEEAGYIAVQCPDSGLYHTMDEMLVVEVVDDAGHPCAPGEVGRVLITDLRNHATPLFRYVIGDFAEAAPPCSCGRGLGTLKRIMGRERNMIRKPDGTRHWPLTGYKRYREIAPIVQYQMVQHSLERIELRLVTERPLTSDEEAALRAHLHTILKFQFAIDFSYHQGRLQTGPNGKFEEFVSKIGA
jgi:phenylacetate-CoA ligase